MCAPGDDRVPGVVGAPAAQAAPAPQPRAPHGVQGQALGVCVWADCYLLSLFTYLLISSFHKCFFLQARNS